MRAIVLYESMYGNTRAVAHAIAEGMAALQVSLIPVGAASAETTESADLLVIGAPTHAGGLSRTQTRAQAVLAAERSTGALVLEPDAAGAGVREWLAALQPGRTRVAAFDTRVRGAGLIGHAAPKIARALRRLGYELADGPHSFFVTRQNALLPGELERARAWGQVLAAHAETLTGS